MKVIVDTPIWSLAFRKKIILNGIQGSHTVFLICAVAIKNDWEIFTEDKDFFEYKKYLQIKTYKLI